MTKLQPITRDYRAMKLPPLSGTTHLIHPTIATQTTGTNLAMIRFHPPSNSSGSTAVGGTCGENKNGK
jgi:hypothetical protein